MTLNSITGTAPYHTNNPRIHFGGASRTPIGNSVPNQPIKMRQRMMICGKRQRLYHMVHAVNFLDVRVGVLTIDAGIDSRCEARSAPETAGGIETEAKRVTSNMTSAASTKRASSDARHPGRATTF